MKRPIIISLLFLMSFNVMALRVRPTVLTGEQKKQEIREMINLDYSVPDYNVNRPDAKVIFFWHTTPRRFCRMGCWCTTPIRKELNKLELRIKNLEMN